MLLLAISSVCIFSIKCTTKVPKYKHSGIPYGQMVGKLTPHNQTATHMQRVKGALLVLESISEQIVGGVVPPQSGYEATPLPLGGRGLGHSGLE